MTHSTIKQVIHQIEERSRPSRAGYLAKIDRMRKDGRARDALSCGNLAHAAASCPQSDKNNILTGDATSIAIVSAYNDMLSAHQPYHRMLDKIKGHISSLGGVAQMAGGVPAMCDGVTQGQPGMEMSLFSREVIALSTALALSHNVFDGGLLFGTCDKIVPGLLMGALSFGHLPFIFVPSGPMPTGISNEEKAKVRQDYAAGKVGRDELLLSESRAYHSPGICTFYGTANTNQMLLEMMGLQLPGSSFVQPGDPLREALSDEAATCVLALAANGGPGLGELVTATSVVNGIVGLLATGGSTNHTLHIPAIAAAAGLVVTWDDFAELSQVVPLLARVYPNGSADVNAFHKAGGTLAVMKELLDAGMLVGDVPTITGQTLRLSLRRPVMASEGLDYVDVPAVTPGGAIVTTLSKPFQPTGGLALLSGNLGRAVIKISAVKEQHRKITAPAVVFDSQEAFLKAFEDGALERDFVAVLRFQGPQANGMPELHKLTPPLGVLQDKGFNVALATDGRMSGASGKVPAAIHISPEAATGGPLAFIQDGDIVILDAQNGTLHTDADLTTRTPKSRPQAAPTYGRELFTGFRQMVGSAESGGSIFSSTYEGNQP